MISLLRPAAAAALLAPAAVHPQGTCADLNVLSVTYAAFNSTSVEVVAHTDPGSFFSYPSFSLVNEMGDTITREEINFFGIGENVQTHSSPVVDGQSLPPTPFVGDLVLTYYDLEGTGTCVYPFNGPLCPLTFCEPLQVFMFNSGSVVDASFDWTMTDADGMVIGSGDLTIEASDQQTDLDELCLNPGTYTLHMEQTSGLAGAFQYGVTRQLFMSAGPQSIFFQNQENHLPFDFFEPCFEGANSIVEATANGISLLVVEQRLILERRDGTPLGTVEVLDASGRLLHRSGTNGTQTSIDLGPLSSGIFLVRLPNTSFVQRFILP